MREGGREGVGEKEKEGRIRKVGGKVRRKGNLEDALESLDFGMARVFTSTEIITQHQVGWICLEQRQHLPPCHVLQQEWSTLLVAKNHRSLNPHTSEKAECDPGQSTAMRAHETSFYNLRFQSFQLCSKTRTNRTDTGT